MWRLGNKHTLCGASFPHFFVFLSRRETYEWLNRWLGSEEWGTGEAKYEESPAGTLHCTSTGEVLTSLGGRSVVERAAFSAT